MRIEVKRRSQGVANHETISNKPLTSYSQDCSKFTLQCLVFPRCTRLLANRGLGVIDHRFSSTFRSAKPTISNSMRFV
jgi:hypothetical protein